MGEGEGGNVGIVGGMYSQGPVLLYLSLCIEAVLYQATFHGTSLITCKDYGK